MFDENLAGCGEVSAESETLCRSRLFRGVDDGAVKTLLNTCPVLELCRGQRLLSPGQVDDSIYVVLSGRLQVHASGSNDDPAGMLAAGDSVGELAVLSRRPVSALVVAAGTARVLAIREQTLWDLIAASPELTRNLFLLLVRSLRGEEVIHLINQASPQRPPATVDMLTGLHNRAWLNEALRRQVEHYSHTGNGFLLMTLEVDELHDFRDHFGQEAADQVLCRVAGMMMQNVRPTDLLARYDQSTFAVIVNNTDASGARIVAERIRKAVIDNVVPAPDANVPPTTVTLAITQVRPRQTAERLLAAAEAVLARAKESGGNCIVEKV